MFRELTQVDDSQWSQQLSDHLSPRLKPAEFWSRYLTSLNSDCKLPRGHQNK